MKRLVVITSESVWLVEQGEASAHVVGRASFGHHMPNDRDYAGPIASGPDGPVIKVGGRLVVHTADGVVTSGAIIRIVEHELRPARVVDEGFIDITPTWSGALRLLVEVREWKGLTDMALAADRYVEAVRLGLITQADLDIIARTSGLR